MILSFNYWTKLKNCYILKEIFSKKRAMLKDYDSTAGLFNNPLIPNKFLLIFTDTCDKKKEDDLASYFERCQEGFFNALNFNALQRQTTE